MTLHRRSAQSLGRKVFPCTVTPWMKNSLVLGGSATLADSKGAMKVPMIRVMQAIPWP
jgi:hypothetical protein